MDGDKKMINEENLKELRKINEDINEAIKQLLNDRYDVENAIDTILAYGTEEQKRIITEGEIEDEE